LNFNLIRFEKQVKILSNNTFFILSLAIFLVLIFLVDKCEALKTLFYILWVKSSKYDSIIFQEKNFRDRLVRCRLFWIAANKCFSSVSFIKVVSAGIFRVLQSWWLSGLIYKFTLCSRFIFVICWCEKSYANVIDSLILRQIVSLSQRFVSDALPRVTRFWRSESAASQFLFLYIWIFNEFSPSSPTVPL